MKKNFLPRKRLYLSLLIWFGNVLLWAVLTSLFIKESPLPGWFWILFLTVYAIQAAPYWLLLKRNFNGKRQSNIALVISMPFLILFGLWFFFMFDSALKSTLGGFK